MYKSLVFGDVFSAHLKSHQRCTAAFCRPVKFFHTDWIIISLWFLSYTQRHCHVRIEKSSVQTDWIIISLWFLSYTQRHCHVKRFVPPLGRAGLLTGAEINGTGPDDCLPELDMFPLLQVMCLWYMCFCAEVFFFSVLRLYSKWSIVWGLKIFFPPLSPHVKAVSF